MTNLNYLSAVVVVVVVAEVPLAKHVTGDPLCAWLSMGSDHDQKRCCQPVRIICICTDICVFSVLVLVLDTRLFGFVGADFYADI